MSSLINQIEEASENADVLLEMYDVLVLLYNENVDYIEINNLGDPHHNESMKRARDVLAKIEGERL